MSVSELPNPIDLAAEPAFRLGNLQVSPSTREVVSEREREVLEPRVMQVLVTLARRRGEVVSRDHLIKECWGGRVVGEDAINRCIAKVRRLSEVHSGFAIETITRVGYRVTEDAAPVSDSNSTPAPALQSPSGPVELKAASANDDYAAPPNEIAHKKFHFPKWGYVASAAVLISVVGIVWVMTSARDEHPTAPAAPAPVASAAVTLAVLPFVNMSSDPEQEYFSDGLTEELLNQLAQIRGLRVTARTSSFVFKSSVEDVRVIGQKLGVVYILEGSVRKDGDKLRITTQLINSKDGTNRWSQSYNRDLNSVFALQEEVSKDVAKALSIAFDVGDLPRVAGGTTDVNAYDKYLLARRLFQQNGAPESRQAAQLLRESVALDPTFSRAWLLLSYALYESTMGLSANEVAAVYKEATAAAERVLALTPNAWGAQLLRASRFMRAHQWKQAEEVLTAAMPLHTATSANYEQSITYALFLRNVGRAREAVQIYEQARDADPLSVYVSSDLQTWLDAAGRSAEAQIEYERSRTLAGNPGQANIFAMMRLLARGDARPSEIDAMFQRLLKEEKLKMPITHALAGKFRDSAQVREAINAAIDNPENQGSIRLTVIMLYADRFGEKDLAMKVMTRMVRDLNYTATLWMPLKSDLRSDPKFKELVREQGLVDYWRTSGKWGDFCEPVGSDDFKCD